MKPISVLTRMSSTKDVLAGHKKRFVSGIYGDKPHVRFTTKAEDRTPRGGAPSHKP